MFMRRETLVPVGLLVRAGGLHHLRPDDVEERIAAEAREQRGRNDESAAFAAGGEGTEREGWQLVASGGEPVDGIVGRERDGDVTQGEDAARPGERQRLDDGV